MVTPPIIEAAAGHYDLCKLTVEQYDYLIEAGLLPHDPSTELLDGFIVKKDRSAVCEARTAVGDRHRIVVLRLMALAYKFPPLGCYLQVQQPILLPPNHEPEPDASVVAGSIDDPSEGKPHASDVFSVIEVSDNSLRRDLGEKLRAYAQAAIPEYVVVDLVNNFVLDHRRPIGDRYDDTMTLRRGGTLEVLAAGGVVQGIAVSPLLP